MSRFAFGIRLLSIAASLCLAVVACRANNGIVVPSVMPHAGARTGGTFIQPLAKGKIRHVVIIIQENRSFNNLFLGYPGATTQSWGFDSEKNKITLKPISLSQKWDMQHNGQGFIISCNGTGKVPGTDCRMNGFDKEQCNGKLGACPKSKYLAYTYASHDETKPYFDMARQYVLADEMYASDFDISSFISHQYIIAGVNPNSSVDYPYGDWGCTGGPSDKIPILLKDRKWLNDQHHAIKTERPCWKPKTLADELDAKNLAWSFYATPVSSVSPKYACGRRRKDGADIGSGSTSSWSAYEAVSDICYSRDWDNDVKPFTPPSKFLTDVAGGELRTVTWITPTCGDSDHAGCNGNAPPTSGPSWVASVVNAIGHSKYWDSCAIFIFWDDPGGWYDPEPPKAIDYDNYDSLGYRLPLLIISPYAKKGYVDHTRYEHGSILKFVEDVFGLPRLEPESEKLASDRRANPPDDAFDFSQAPRKFVTIKAPLNANYFIHERLDGQPPDSD
jgi:phospholipase C